MLVEIDSHSGFCYGVTRTIERAEEALKEGRPVYCLGEIVHNEEEVERLKSKGLIIINQDDLKDIDASKILIRAHGEPPATYQEIEKNANLLTDGTCPIVMGLQKKVRDAWNEMKQVNGHIIIYGKKGHAEVIGLAGQTNNEAIIVSHEEELEKIDFSKPVALFAQTTQSPEGFESVIEKIRNKMSGFFPDEDLPLKITDSICGHVSKRGLYLKEFAKKHEVIVFVSGTNSSNDFGCLMQMKLKRNGFQTQVR